MKQYQINLGFQMLCDVLSGALYKMHVVAHTFLICSTRRTGDHFSRKIAKRDVMTALGHFYRRLSFATTGVQHAQRLVAKSGQNGVQILPEDRLTELPLCGAINVARKLFRDVIKIAIPHWESSTR